jgi:hypothetical protein
VLSGTPTKRELLRSKLAALGKDYSGAVQAAVDYRDLNIDLDQLNDRGIPHISIVNRGTYVSIANEIPKQYWPLLTEEALRTAMGKMNDDPTRRLEWLKIAKELFNTKADIKILGLKELSRAEREVKESNGSK